MIVQKPQFDVDHIKGGHVYHVSKKTRGYVELSTNCIIVKVSPLMLEVMYYDVEDERMQVISIAIHEVVNNVFTFTKMEVVKIG